MCPIEEKQYQNPILYRLYFQGLTCLLMPSDTASFELGSDVLRRQPSYHFYIL
ncbi:hypothetical protein SynNOUM97013_02101 [Synechococcus sp. NOUM97013]|nr:hypothetical protein SynNOUM97013_02101 [Synechococcus sp. NOUM97013]